MLKSLILKGGAAAAAIVLLFAASAIRGEAGAIPLTTETPFESAQLLIVTPSSGPLIPMNGDGTAHLAYELYVTNFGRNPVRIDALRVVGAEPGGFSLNLTGRGLEASFARMGSTSRTAAQAPVLPAGAGGMIFVFCDFGSLKTPARLVNSLVVEREGDRKTRQLIPLSPLVLSKVPAAVIDSPFKGGGRWMAANGPSNTSLHRRAIIVLDGKAHIAQRYAIDWIKLGADGNTYSGDQYRNSSYHCYGVPIIAVADGRIVEVVDGLKENIPHMPKRAVVMTAKTAAGNHVIEQIGPGEFVGYAHMIPGSIAVRDGERVSRGQVLGRLGDSGNSDEPHLHLQICDGPSFLQCEGVPMEFKHMSLVKYQIEPRGDKPYRLELGASHAAAGQEPMEDELAEFPAN